MSLLVAASALAEDPPVDPLAPTTSASDAQVSQLHTATLVTRDLDALRAFYVEGLGLTLRGPIAIDRGTRDLQRQLWGMPRDLDWELYLLHRPGVADTVRVRVLVPSRDTPRIHDTWNALQPGPFSLGFPAGELASWDTALREQGHRSMNPMSRYSVPRPDGSSYGMHETIWKAPDFMHAVTLSRRDGMPQLGPIDEVTGQGGPVYSAHVVQDSDEVLAFYTDVLGFELRSDREWKSHGSKGALAVPDGTVFRFSILYAPGASHGHLLFVDFRERSLPPTGVAPRPPNRGLASWSFPVRDLDAVEARVRAHGSRVIFGPVTYDSPLLGPVRVLTTLAPNGFLIELFERQTGVAQLSAEDLLARAVEAAGGESWKRPRTLRLRGWAEHFPEGDLERRVLLDGYAMDRVFPSSSEEAHAANGKVRFEIRHGDQLFLRSIFDGTRSDLALGPLAKEHARRFAPKNNYGFGIIRFADGPGFALRRLADDQVDGHPCHMLEVIDPKGGRTVFGIDRRHAFVRSVSFGTEQGQHTRIYSAFAWTDERKRFLQPHRVRIFNEGALWFDVRWQVATVDQPIADEVFRIETPGTQSGTMRSDSR